MLFSKNFTSMLFFFWPVVIDVPTDGEGGVEDENRSVSGFLHFDTTTKGIAFWIHDKFIDIYLNCLKFLEILCPCLQILNWYRKAV